ncbi:hypothetical protein, partial [Blautia wexlerae]|uniref:hypothetical protein n=1 Tax=Blautia wexlerae TaxID=418240 RepID=UPI00325A4996
DTPWALHKEVHISCIAKRVTENGVNSNTSNVIFGNRGNYNCSHNGKCDIVISKSYERNRSVFRRMADC